MSKLTEEQKDALGELHSAYKNAERTPEHAFEDVNTVWNLIAEAHESSNNDLFEALESDLQHLLNEVEEYNQEEKVPMDKVEYFYNKIEQIANSYNF
jgi:uncharacterized protein YbgA (DUF1722 family)